MAITRTLKCLAFALATVAGANLQAQDSPYSFDLKLHGGLVGGSIQTNHGDSKLFGLGIEGRYSLGGQKALTFELGYDVMGGRWQDKTPVAGAVWIDPVSAVPGTEAGTAPTTTWNGQPLWLSPQSSIDLRKETAQGLNLRVGYTNALPWSWTQGLTWKAGLSLDAFKVMSEFTGTLMPNNDNGDIDPDYYEGWAFQKSKVKFGIGAFAGVGMTLTKDLRLELNLRDLATGHYDYHPFTYTGRPAALEEKTVHSLAFEISLALTL